MNSVEDLDVFKLAHQLAFKTYSATKTFPKEETFSLVEQMRRAAASVGMNLMEGAMRAGKQGVPSICRHCSGFGRTLTTTITVFSTHDSRLFSDPRPRPFSDSRTRSRPHDHVPFILYPFALIL